MSKNYIKPNVLVINLDSDTDEQTDLESDEDSSELFDTTIKISIVNNSDIEICEESGLGSEEPSEDANGFKYHYVIQFPSDLNQNDFQSNNVDCIESDILDIGLNEESDDEYRSDSYESVNSEMSDEMTDYDIDEWLKVLDEKPVDDVCNKAINNHSDIETSGLGSEQSSSDANDYVLPLDSDSNQTDLHSNNVDSIGSQNLEFDLIEESDDEYRCNSCESVNSEVSDETIEYDIEECLEVLNEKPVDDVSNGIINNHSGIETSGLGSEQFSSDGNGFRHDCVSPLDSVSNQTDFDSIKTDFHSNTVNSFGSQILEIDLNQESDESDFENNTEESLEDSDQRPVEELEINNNNCIDINDNNDENLNLINEKNNEKLNENIEEIVVNQNENNNNINQNNDNDIEINNLNNEQINEEINNNEVNINIEINIINNENNIVEEFPNPEDIDMVVENEIDIVGDEEDQRRERNQRLADEILLYNKFNRKYSVLYRKRDNCQ